MPTEADKFNFRKSIRVKLSLILTTILIIVFMFPKGESLEFEVTLGAVWLQNDLISTLSFPLLKDKVEYEKERLQAANSVRKIFSKQEIDLISITDTINNYYTSLSKSLLEDNRNNTNFGFSQFNLSRESYQTFLELIKIDNILTLQFDKTIADCEEISKKITSHLYSNGIIETVALTDTLIDLREGKYQHTESYLKYNNINEAKKYAKDYLSRKFSVNNQLNNAVYETIVLFLRETIKYDDNLTKISIFEAQNKISRNIGLVQQDERIVAKHDRITNEIKRKIDSYREAKSEEMGFWGRLLQNIGKFLHVSIIFVLFSIYIYLFRKNILNDNIKISLILIVFLIVFLSTFIIQNLNVKAPVEYLVLVPVASMLLTIMFDSRIGFYATIVVALISGALRGNDYVFATTHIIAGALSAYTVRDIKNRSQVFRSFLFILLGYLLAIFAFGFERFDTFNNLFEMSVYASANALISPILTFGLIIFFEKSFKITTELTFLELTNFNHPLLRELAKSAPGTFNHSMTIGVLVENATEAINADQILARVGAYFHDIGKTVAPFTFVENQLNNENIHEKLTPERSRDLILEHIKFGIELAKKNKLPQEVIDFIPMHHGTMVISYFYEKAKELYGEENVNIDDYRYSGPKPNTKETAILMLADACESAVRAIDEPDAKRIENLINNLIQKRIEDGQLDESPLTFNDIKIIKTSFLNTLLSQYHKRIRYPKQDELENNQV